MKVLVISNMYPDRRSPASGVFIANFVRQLEMLDGVECRLSVMRSARGRLPKVWSYAKFYIGTFIRLLLHSYDIIYVHYASHSAAPVLAAAHFRKLRIFTNVHGSDVFPTKKSHLLMQPYTVRLLEISEKVIAPSEFFRRQVAEKYHRSLSSVYVYPSGGIARDRFYLMGTAQREAAAREFGLKPHKKYIGFAGRLVGVKGWDLFVKAAVQIREKFPQYEYLMIGSGPEEHLLEEALAASGLKSVAYRFPAQPQAQLGKLYNLMGVFVFPTIAAESLGLTALEAMACGVPVIASAYGAPSFYVEEGRNGFLFERGSEWALAEKLEGFLRLSGRESEALGENAMKTAAEYGEDACLRTLEKIMETGKGDGACG